MTNTETGAPDPCVFERMLRERRAYLASKLMVFEASLDQEPNKDVEDRAVERENDEVIEELGATGLEELKQIDAALKRMESQTYGNCLSCGEQISPERLTVIPHASVCQVCMRS